MKYVGVTVKMYPPSTSLCGSSKARQLKPFTAGSSGTSARPLKPPKRGCAVEGCRYLATVAEGAEHQSAVALPTLR
jgi:hypothetical protein